MDVLYQLSYIGWSIFRRTISKALPEKALEAFGHLERKTGLEPATLSLEG
ncbi:MAG: hypothetical protein RL021_858 [Bacteroidota bacterium]|jgi:hypothetical protein